MKPLREVATTIAFIERLWWVWLEVSVWNIAVKVRIIMDWNWTIFSLLKVMHQRFQLLLLISRIALETTRQVLNWFVNRRLELRHAIFTIVRIGWANRYFPTKDRAFVALVLQRSFIWQHRLVCLELTLVSRNFLFEFRCRASSKLWQGLRRRGEHSLVRIE